MAGLTAIAITGTAALSYRALSAEITEQYVQRARGAAVVLDREITEGRVLQQPERLTEQLRALQARYPDLLRLRLYARVEGSYRVVASSDPAQVGAPAEAHDVEPLRTGTIQVTELVLGGRRVMEVNYPLHQDGRPLAVLGAYASLAARDRDVASLLQKVVALAVLVFAGLVASSYLIARAAVLGPLRRMLVTTERAVGGELAEEVDDGFRATSADDARYEVARFALVFNAMVQRVRRQQETLREVAITDPLTGLHNRRYFEEIVQREMARAARDGRPFSIVVVDVNGLRDVNNRLGHLAGDELLRRTAAFLRRHVRTADEVIRWGGDEFLILMPATGPEGAAQVEGRLKAQLAETAAQDREGVSVSVGVATWSPGSDLEAVLREADTRMYADKRRAPGEGPSRG